jgi:hypothetical protein
MMLRKGNIYIQNLHGGLKMFVILLSPCVFHTGFFILYKKIEIRSGIYIHIDIIRHESAFTFLLYLMGNNYNHTLTWSTTRITVLEYCNKKYYFNYYPHALRNINEEVWLTALLLKNLKSMDMRVGEKTHHLLSDYLRALKK